MNYRKKVSEEGMINSRERGFGLGKFSAPERDRRWRRVHELMAGKQLNVIVGFRNQSHGNLFQAAVGKTARSNWSRKFI